MGVIHILLCILLSLSQVGCAVKFQVDKDKRIAEVNRAGEYSWKEGDLEVKINTKMESPLKEIVSVSAIKNTTE